jgi:hypothetical protein
MDLLTKDVLYCIFSKLDLRSLCNLYLSGFKSTYVWRYCLSADKAHKMVCWNLELFKKFYRDKRIYDRSLYTYVAVKGQFVHNDDSMIFVSEIGNLDVVKWIDSGISDRKNPDLACAFERAARYGHFDVMKWLKNNGYPIEHETALDNTLIHGDISLVEWVIQLTGTRILCWHSVLISGKIELVRWIYKRYPQTYHYQPTHTYDCAIIGESTEILDWLWNRGHRPNSQNYNFTIWNDLPQMAHWLYKRGVKWTKDQTTLLNKENPPLMKRWFESNDIN